MALRKNKKLLLLIAIWVHYLLLFSSYSVYSLLPIVYMGERSWPLYFFILDGITVVLVILTGIVFLYSKTKKQIYWIFVFTFLIFPLINIYATFSDLNRKLCADPQCNLYLTGPDLKNIELKWEKFLRDRP